jgi:hypothetical protein
MMARLRDTEWFEPVAIVIGMLLLVLAFPPIIWVVNRWAGYWWVGR